MSDDTLSRRQVLGGMTAVGAASVLGAASQSAQGQTRATASDYGPSQAPPITDIKGKVAYITASSDGIGLGIARAFSKAGAKVVIGYRNEKRLKEALPLFDEDNPGILPIWHDVTHRDGWQRLLDEVNDKWGNLHVLVNNAGIKTLTQASQATWAQWDSAVAVNLTGVWNGVSICLPHMKEHGEGAHIVTTCSMGGLLPGANAGIYTTTKIAAVGLMESLRIELEETNVGTSAYCPGLVNTENNPELADQGFGAAGMDPLEAGERVLNGIYHNDLFILTHPEFKDGMQERYDAIMASVPEENKPVPEDRLRASQRVLHADIYPKEIVHRSKKRDSYRG
jgi:NAD(P)-dependent dehydrogenase (short-subunit alcohol dehydrogenase family)